MDIKRVNESLEMMSMALGEDEKRGKVNQNTINKRLLDKVETLVAAGDYESAAEELKNYKYDNRTQDAWVSKIRYFINNKIKMINKNK